MKEQCRPVHDNLPGDNIDKTLIRWMLSLTPAERLRVLESFLSDIDKLKSAALKSPIQKETGQSTSRSNPDKFCEELMDLAEDMALGETIEARKAERESAVEVNLDDL